MDRFQILKGEETTFPSTMSVDGKVVGNIKNWETTALKLSEKQLALRRYFSSIYSSEASTVVNGRRGWLNRNGAFYPEEVVREMGLPPHI